jgi:hypothetical protein
MYSNRQSEPAALDVYFPIPSNRKRSSPSSLVLKCFPGLVHRLCSRLAAAWVPCYHVGSGIAGREYHARLGVPVRCQALSVCLFFRRDIRSFFSRVSRFIEASNLKKNEEGNIREPLLLNH